MKVAVIGGGSTYTPELVQGFLELRASLPISELWLMDIDEERLQIVGNFARRIVAQQGRPFEVRLSLDRRDAIRESSYIISQIRVGGMTARREDEYLGRRHGLIGQETTGIGGMAKALRTIPVILEIAQEISELSPKALFVNFTNPAGLITEAIIRHAPGISVVGICNSPITTKMGLLNLLEEHEGLRFDPQDVRLDTLGLNHLSWYRGLHVDGIDFWPQVMEATIETLQNQPEPDWPPQLIRSLGLIPNSYLSYYYNTKKKLAAQATWPPSRAEQVIKIESALLEKYANPACVELPDELMNRGGAYYSTMAAKLLTAMHNDIGEVQVLNAKNRGAVSAWPEDWVLELPCKVDGLGIHPLPTEPLPPICYGLIVQVKAYELLTIEAAVRGDRSAAHHALLAHPLGPDADEIVSVLEDMLNTHRTYLPRFWNEPLDG
jgi:6-phospho-beta-glucosidase